MPSLSGARASAALPGSSTVPSLSAAVAVGGGTQPVNGVVVVNNGGCWGGWGGWGYGGWGYPWYSCYSPAFYGYYGYGYPYGLSFGFSFGYGYPYYNCYYPRYRYWPRYYAGYPYYGDYCSYPTPYYDDYPYVYRDVEVPDYVTAPTALERRLPVAETVVPEDALAPVPTLDGEEAFYASLKPAQLSFVLGLHAMEGGEYDQATESFFNASVEDPDSRLVKVFLATSLFSVGEYHYAAEYLRLSLETWDEFPSYDWNVRGLYGSEKDFEAHLALLERHTALDPGDIDAQIVLGFIAMSSGEAEKAGAAFDAVRTLSTDPVELDLASRYLGELEDRSGAFPRSDDERFDLAVREDPAIQAFLAGHAPKDVPALPIR